MTSLLTRALAEALGTLLLLACVVGSGVMGVALSQGNDGVALLANAAATAGILYVLIVVMGPVSGGHFNPAVSLVEHLRGRLSPAAFAAYVGAQLVATPSLNHCDGPVRAWVPACTRSRPNIAWASTTPATAPTSCAPT